MEDNKNSENEIVPSPSPSPKTSSHSKSSKKRNWAATNEKETYRTVVVNYYGKSHKKKPHSKVRTTPNPHAWLTPGYVIKPITHASDDDDAAPNLCNLYAEQHNSKASMGKKIQKQTAAANVEIYKVPLEQKASLQEHAKELAQSYTADASTDDVIEYTEDDENGNEQVSKYTEEESASDGEETDKAVLVKPIESVTKGTQNPERDNCSQQMPSKIKLRDTDDKNTACPSLQKIKVKGSTSAPAATPTSPNFRQRQLELHRYRVQVEQKRMDLLELKMAREREEMVREKVLFEKELEIRVLKQIKEERNNQEKSNGSLCMKQ